MQWGVWSNYGSETANSCPKSKTAPSTEPVSVCALFHKSTLVPWLPCQKIPFYKNFTCHGSKFSSFYILLIQLLSRPTRRSYPLSPEIQLLAALRFYAVGSFLEVDGDGYGPSKTSVWRCVHSVTNILLRHATDYIRMPFARHIKASMPLCVSRE